MIALDISEGHSYVVWYANGICQNELQVLHTQSGFAKLLKLTLRAKHPIVYFEATGGYSRPVEHFCCEAGTKVPASSFQLLIGNNKTSPLP